MQILTSDNEVIICTKESSIKIKEVIYNEILIGLNVVIVNQNKEYLVDTYDDEDTAEEVVRYLFNNIDKDRIDINKLNRELEI